VKPAPLLSLLALGIVATFTAQADSSTASPTIKSIRRAAPPPDQLTIQTSSATAATAEQKLENFRRELELSPDPKTRAQTLRRIADIDMQLADRRGMDDPASKPWLDEAIATYEQLLSEDPLAPQNDSVLYQLARAYRALNRQDDTIRTLTRLEHDFPESGLVDDSRFMAGELLFSEHRYPDAEREYAPLVRKNAWAGDLFEPAQYKYAWTLFDQDEFEASADIFIQMLDRLLANNAPKEPEAALATVNKDRQDIARDALRGLNLCFIRLGGPKALNDYFEKHPEPRFSPTIYISLGDAFLEKRRYTDAAETYETFVARHPNDPDSPVFETRTIAAYQAGGFSEAVLTAKGHFAESYDPNSTFWKDRQPSGEVLKALRQHLDDLAKYHHELAQKDPVKNRAEFAVAADWYRKILKDFPNDPQRAETNLALADALLEGGDTRNAADEYMHSAYDYPVGPKSAEAAYAAVQTYEKYLQDAPDDQKAAARKLSAEAALQLAQHFPDHPQKIPVLTRAAEELYAIGDLPRALDAAAQVISAEPALPLMRSALSVTADAQFSLQHYAEAEQAYGRLMQIIPPADPEYHAIEERHTASIYKAADAARDSGDLHAAAQAYERLGQSATSSTVRGKADFDAAASYMQLQDWANAERVLEPYAQRHPDSALIADADKKLAVAYHNDHKLAQAAVVYQRIAGRPSESAETRQESVWLVAQLYDQAGMKSQAMQSYQNYLSQYPKPFDRALEARERLVELHEGDQNPVQYEASLRDIITADANAGADRSDKSRALAARALLAIGRMRAAEVDSIHLTQPLKKSVARKKQALQTAIDTLSSAANAGFSDVSTAATFQLATLYRHFGRALIESEKPRNLSAAAQEQYDLLLEEQAEPFDEKAIQTYELNLQRIKAGVFDDWIAKSAAALAEMAPAKYGKLEMKDMSYDQAQ
jgi:tetratricopeptide (TPR) repeat protein